MEIVPHLFLGQSHLSLLCDLISIVQRQRRIANPRGLWRSMVSEICDVAPIDFHGNKPRGGRYRRDLRFSQFSGRLVDVDQ